MNTPNHKNPFPKLLILSLFLIILDQVSKAIIRTSLQPGESIKIIDNILQFTFTPNYRGLSWWVPEMPLSVHILFDVLIVLIILFSFPVYLFFTKTRHKSIWADLAVVGIFSGCYGNFLDKFFTPYTTDFIHIFNLRPKPNLADVFCTIGLIGLFIEVILYYRIKRPIWKGIRHFLTGDIVTFKEFFRFLKNGFKE
ncbi:signal peptidase II [candidate division KSB1 bacterium]